MGRGAWQEIRVRNDELKAALADIALIADGFKELREPGAAKWTVVALRSAMGVIEAKADKALRSEKEESGEQ